MPDTTDILKSTAKILDELNSTQNCERILHNIIGQLVKTLHCKTCAIVELNPKTEFLEIRNVHNLSWNFCKNYRKAIDSPLLNEIIWRNEPIHIPDRRYALRVVEQLRMEHEFASAYVAPLNSQQQAFGFLYVDSDEINYFTGQNKEIVHIFAKVISACIFWDRLSEKLKKLKQIDEDSGALSFDSCLPHLKENFNRSSRMNESYSLLLIDVEKFGQIITLYGLQEANKVLKDIVNKIAVQLRKYDEICRFGADEFLLSLPDVNHENAWDVAQKIYAVFYENTFASRQISVSAYIGVVTYPQNAHSLNGLLTAAKNALQAAKKMDQKPRIATIKTMYE